MRWQAKNASFIFLMNPNLYEKRHSSFLAPVALVAIAPWLLALP
jgi:hypothetical protein